MLYIDFKGYKGDFTNKKMNEQIKSYIEKILGISVQFHHWKGELELPFYITERYDMRLAELDDIRCIFLSPKKKLNQIGSLKKQIRRIQMEESLPVVFVKMDLLSQRCFYSCTSSLYCSRNPALSAVYGNISSGKIYKGNQDFGYVSALYTATALLLVLSAGKLSLHE